MQAGTPCPLAPGPGRDDGGTGGDCARLGGVQGRQMAAARGQEGRKQRQRRGRKGGKQVKERQEKNWLFRGGLC